MALNFGDSNSEKVHFGDELISRCCQKFSFLLLSHLSDNPWPIYIHLMVSVSKCLLSSKVTLMEDSDQNIHLKNLSTHSSTTEEEALNLLFLGDTNRMIAEVRQ